MSTPVVAGRKRASARTPSVAPPASSASPESHAASIEPLDPATLQAGLRDLVAHADLVAVDVVDQRLTRPCADRLEGPLPSPAAWTTTWTLGKTLHPRVPSATGTAVLVEVRATWSDEVAPTVHLAEAHVRVRLAYVFRDLAAAPHEQVLAKFADDLGLHHAWPFLRERLHALGASMGLPPVVLPLRKR